MLELRSVSYRYAGYAKPVLHDVDLVLEDGEIVGLVGPNEAGKSSLCLVASGLAPGSIGGELRGTLVIDGEAVSGLPTHELAEHVVVCFQNPNTQRSGITGTVFEEVALGAVNLGLPVTESVRRTDEAMALLGITGIADRDPARLSGGQSQIVAIASLIAMRPRHLILDEPTAQLDPEGTRLVGEALRRLATTGTSLLIAEHKTDLLDDLCTRVVALVDGRVFANGPAREVLAAPEIETSGVEPPARVRLARRLAGAGIANGIAIRVAAAADAELATTRDRFARAEGAA